MRLKGAAILMTMAAACGDSTAVQSAIVVPRMDSPGVQAYVVQEPGATADRVVLTIHVDSKAIGVAAYQGRLTFDATSLEISETSTPVDGTRFVNAMASAGMVRFAGFTETTFAGTAAVRLVVKPLKAGALANVDVSLDAAGESNGTSLSRAQMVAHHGVVIAPTLP